METGKGPIFWIPDQIQKTGHWPLLTVSKHSQPRKNIRSILSIEIQTQPHTSLYYWKNNRGKENSKVQIPRPKICAFIYYFHIMGKYYTFILSWSLTMHCIKDSVNILCFEAQKFYTQKYVNFATKLPNKIPQSHTECKIKHWMYVRWCDKCQVCDNILKKNDETAFHPAAMFWPKSHPPGIGWA